ncbi:hypothetical protein BJ508DRAFT_412705 [Ascobolus immersus RN42]|uniref:Uncharacterized protein n=1 Tax=Ascobolus immersus RN42 TaxID=1160509 RepID=A0A3N4IFB2_ASCIM|nr:hypothetical protein BJ508DRAFT_412705 [Ascobolus immersus RN42]
MARSIPSSPSTIAATNLTRLLTRLSHRLSLTTTPITPFEHQKLHQNLSHAKSLLNQLENGLSPGPDGLRLREDCVRWKGLIRDLEEGLCVVGEELKGEDVPEEEDEEEEEYEPEPKPALSITPEPPTTVIAPVKLTPQEPTPTPTAVLRNRKAPALNPLLSSTTLLETRLGLLRTVGNMVVCGALMLGILGVMALPKLRL